MGTEVSMQFKKSCLFTEQDPFALNEITYVIGNTENRQSSEEEDGTGHRDQTATSTSRLEELDLLSKLSQQVERENPRGTFSKSLSRLEDWLKNTIESLHETISCLIEIRWHHSE